MERVSRCATGTAVSYKPGSITGGLITHDCGKTRGIGYFIEGIMPMAPFSKAPFALTLTGITSTEEDISVREISAYADWNSLSLG